MSKEDVRERITMTRLRLVDRYPFFGYLLMQVNLIETKSVPTAATDGIRIYYNEKYFDSLNNEELEFVLCHEIMHCVLNHITRKGDRLPFKWNIAIDYATNLILKDSRVGTPPPHVLLSDEFKDMSAEEIYEKIEVQEIPMCTCGGGEGGEGESSSDNNSSSGKCPRCDQGFDRHDYDKARGKESEIESKWKSAVSEAVRSAKQRGTLPAGIERLVKNLLQPQIPWQILLMRYLNSLVKGDYKWIPPNKRYVWQDIYLPRIYDQYLLKVVVAIDTSGSIGEEELIHFLSEIVGMLKCTFDYILWVIPCDAQVYDVQKLKKGESISKIKLMGGGGTCFEPVFEYVEKERINPDVLIYFTDMYGSFPKEPPRYPVIWIATTDDTDAPFGILYRYKRKK